MASYTHQSMGPPRLSLLTDYNICIFLLVTFIFTFKGSGIMAFRYGICKRSYKSLPSLIMVWTQNIHLHICRRAADV